MRGWLWGLFFWAGCVGAAPITGFNQNWSYFPPLDTPGMLARIGELKPQMLRFPGGTVTHSWDWRAGQRSHKPYGVPHPLADVGVLAKAVGARMVLVLDVVHRSLPDQIAMLAALRASGVPVEYVELGNELYEREPDYAERFPGGAEYGAMVNEWAPALRRAFPGVKVGAVLVGREAGPKNPRLAGWNEGVLRQVKVPVDAWIFHLYISEGGRFEAMRARFERVRAAAGLQQAPLWITEYGNQNPGSDPNYLPDLAALADYVEKLPGVEIALNHQLTGPAKNKLSRDGSAFTAEGDLFRARAVRQNPR